jgi:hypothetical protein
VRARDQGGYAATTANAEDTGLDVNGDRKRTFVLVMKLPYNHTRRSDHAPVREARKVSGCHPAKTCDFSNESRHLFRSAERERDRAKWSHAKYKGWIKLQRTEAKLLPSRSDHAAKLMTNGNCSTLSLDGLTGTSKSKLSAFTIAASSEPSRPYEIEVLSKSLVQSKPRLSHRARILMRLPRSALRSLRPFFVATD